MKPVDQTIHLGGGYGKYGKGPCLYCGKWISTNGLGYNAHMMAHVRKDEMYRERDEEGLWHYYIKPKCPLCGFVLLPGSKRGYCEQCEREVQKREGRR